MNPTNNTQPINDTTAKNAIILTAMYEVAFDRLPDAEGFAYWMNEMANGWTTHDVAVAWQVHLPQFGYTETNSVINTFVYNGYEHKASADVLSHWGVLAINAVPSYELMYDAAVKLVGYTNEAHSFYDIY